MTWRCSTCGINWPYHRQYQQCPCGEACSSMCAAAISQEEADEHTARFRAGDTARQRHQEFERYYEEHAVAEALAAFEESFTAHFAKLGSAP